jgi:pimeloyl-ACP methyl ester carboxylesterase
MTAINYPERVKGLILLSSGMPNTRRTREEIHEMSGPPSFIINDFVMWFTLKHFGFAMKSMMGIKESPEQIFRTMLPVSPRNAGILADTNVTNLDMDVNFNAYPVERISAPILLIHAKDDPMAKFANTANFIKRINPQTLIFESGGHLAGGHGNEITEAITGFVEANSSR